MASDTKINHGLKTPALGNDEYLKNMKGLPATKTQAQISKECKPPATSPKGIVGRSVRV